MSVNEEVLKHISKFVKHDLYNAVFYCLRFANGSDSIFKTKQPEDLVFEVLEKISEGKTCFLKDYRAFKGSVYYHLRFKLINHLRLNKKEELVEDLYADASEQNEKKRTGYIDSYCRSEYDEIQLGIENGELRGKIFGLFDKVKEGNEISILEKILEGKQNKDIANEMNVRVAIIENAKKRIFNRIYKKIDKNLLRGIIKCQTGN